MSSDVDDGPSDRAGAAGDGDDRVGLAGCLGGLEVGEEGGLLPGRTLTVLGVRTRSEPSP